MSFNSKPFRLLVCMMIGLVFAVVVNEVSYSFMQSGSTRAPTTIQVIIPMGTSEKIAINKASSVMPDSMSFVLGDVLVIQNEDQVDHRFGNIFIPSGSSAKVTFNNANYYSYECSFEPTKVFGFEVLEPLTPTLRAYGILISGIPMGVLLFIYSLAAYPFKATP